MACIGGADFTQNLFNGKRGSFNQVSRLTKLQVEQVLSGADASFLPEEVMKIGIR